MKIYMFQNDNRTTFKFRYGFTPNRQGGNLPAAGAPWALIKELDIGAAGGLTTKSPGVSAILDSVDTKGFHLATTNPLA